MFKPFLTSVALIAGLAFTTPATAADMNKLAEMLDGKRLDFSQLKPNTITASVALTGKPDTGASAARSSSDGSNRRPIYVDGVLMELPEWVILGQIKMGVFTVVYPGTNIPWTSDEDRHPFYPPPYIPGA